MWTTSHCGAQWPRFPHLLHVSSLVAMRDFPNLWRESVLADLDSDLDVDLVSVVTEGEDADRNVDLDVCPGLPFPFGFRDPTYKASVDFSSVKAIVISALINLVSRLSYEGRLNVVKDVTSIPYEEEGSECRIKSTVISSGNEIPMSSS
jgi:hypothetical protein